MIIIFDYMLTGRPVRTLQHGNLAMNCLPTKLSEINPFVLLQINVTKTIANTNPKLVRLTHLVAVLRVVGEVVDVPVVLLPVLQKEQNCSAVASGES